MGNGNGKGKSNQQHSPSHIVQNVYLPVSRTNDINIKQGQLDTINSSINDLNWLLGQEQASLADMTKQRDYWSNDVTEKTRRIEKLTAERDDMIKTRDELKVELENLLFSVNQLNQPIATTKTKNTILAADYSDKTVDTIIKKEELYNSIKIQNNLMKNFLQLLISIFFLLTFIFLKNFFKNSVSNALRK